MKKTIGRLKKRKDFLKLSKFGQRFVRPGFILQASTKPLLTEESVSVTILPLPNDLSLQNPAFQSQQGIRVGFTASRKVGNAVARNRARRRLKALVQNTQYFKGGYDYVLIARPETLKRPYGELQNDLKFSLKRLGLYEITS